MTTFQSVNVGLGPKDYSSEVTTPTTPRAPITAPLQPNVTPSAEVSAPSTPKRLSFVGLDGQRPLPNPSFNNSFSSQTLSPMRIEPGVLSRGSSHQSTQSTGSQGVEMDDSDDGEGNSDGESVDGETGRPSKKKKGQRFFCTEFAPCNLSFTRSEHLARHIRYDCMICCYRINSDPTAGNILENGRSNVIALGDFRASTTFVNMRKRYMSTRKYPEIL